MNATIITKVEKNAISGFLKRRSKEIERIQEQTADVIETRQKSLVPVRTGNLRSTIEQRRPSADVIQIVEGGDRAPYATFLEYGTRNMAAQPHQRPAAMEGFRYQREQLSKLR